MKMNLVNCLALLLVWHAHAVNARHANCHFLYELQMAEKECLDMLADELPPHTQGCRGMWDNISCWHHADIGEVVHNTCPVVLKNLFTRDGIIKRNCTMEGWSDVYPSIRNVCFEPPSNEEKLVFYTVMKALYTLGHSLSLIALITGSTILCLFRKLHCTRNYIHLNLFFSFILRAIAVLVKDAILFPPENVECTKQPSLIGCKASLIIFHYFIMANFYWLLVEGLYLHTLLMVIFSENRHFIIYLLIGWGFPTVFVIPWIVCRIYLDDTGCWERNDAPIPWRVINWPIMASVILNFILFISIIRILVQKLRCPDVGGNDQSQYRRLAKSTLLLIPLFGINYVVFVYLIEENEEMENYKYYKIFFDLGLGSFQGLVVAILYCFLNSEVQSELKRKWRSLRLKHYIGRDYRLHSSSISRNGTENMGRFHRNSRAQSFLQTETTVV
ncbi:vasoactive intestinal polypeptide receptor 2-like isoform X2 [Carassius carassius]|uniref:vasoactive intestinal polypeptide receptor 2-like isoform X2 n=1 Tax=Carassius carassius TaxID=217509 RepID=UPI0028684D58|nr:vasoactive intestinal polypeptide receptor 2-like isoform X2 [Carassius carassius]